MSATDIIDQPQSSSVLDAAIRDADLPAKLQEDLLATFQPFFNEAMPIIESALRIEVTDATQLTEMGQAREARIALKKIRSSAENARKQTKADVLRQSQAIDNVARVIKQLIEPVEARLLEAETFAERAEAERLAQRKAEREKRIDGLVNNPGVYDLENMTDGDFDQLVNGLEAAKREKEAEYKRQQEEARAEAARKREEEAEAKRKAQERLDAEREAREKAEAEAKEARAKADKAEKLRKEALARSRRDREAMEAKARKEREAVEAERQRERQEAQEREAAAEKALQDERDAAARAEREREAEAARIEAERVEAEKERAAAEAKIEADRVEAERKAALAPDFTKLVAYMEVASESPPLFADDNIRIGVAKARADFHRTLQEIIDQIPF